MYAVTLISLVNPMSGPKIRWREFDRFRALDHRKPLSFRAKPPMAVGVVQSRPLSATADISSLAEKTARDPKRPFDRLDVFPKCSTL